MDHEYGARYRALYQQHWWWRAREHFILEHLHRQVPKGGFGPILDIGCGDGLFFPQLRAFGEPEGLEPEAELLSDAGRARGQIHVQPFDSQFQPGKRYGLIVMLDVLEHLDDDVGALRHVHNLLSPDNGRLVLTVPAFRSLWTGHDDLNHHRTRYTRKTFMHAAEEAGLKVLTCGYFFHWLAPLKLMIRAKEKLAGASLAPPAVPTSWVNQAFLTVSQLEQRTWGRLPIPFGTSLLAICRP